MYTYCPLLIKLAKVYNIDIPVFGIKTEYGFTTQNDVSVYIVYVVYIPSFIVIQYYIMFYVSDILCNWD